MEGNWLSLEFTPLVLQQIERMEDALIALMQPQSFVGLGLILLGAYLWFSKVRNEGTVGSEFKELIEQLQSQIVELKDELKEERDARKIAESEKNEALPSVGSLTTEIKFLKEQIEQLQSSVDGLKSREEDLLKRFGAKA